MEGCQGPVGMDARCHINQGKLEGARLGRAPRTDGSGSHKGWTDVRGGVLKVIGIQALTGIHGLIAGLPTSSRLKTCAVGHTCTSSTWRSAVLRHADACSRDV